MEFESASNFCCDIEPSLNKAYSGFQEMPSLGYNILLKATKEGKLFVLKGLKPEFRNAKIYEEALRLSESIPVSIADIYGKSVEAVPAHLATSLIILGNISPEALQG